MNSLEGKKALVTGGAVRIGRAIADTLADAGVDVGITYRSHQDAAAEFAMRHRANGKLAPTIFADFCEPDATDRIVEALQLTWGRLDILVHSASVFVKTPLDQVEEDHWATVLGVNMMAPLKLSVGCLPLFNAAQGGKIIHLLDLSALRAWPGYLAHSVSKAGLKTLTEGLAVAWAPLNIQVNAITPGAVLWPDDFSETAKLKEIKKTPAGDQGRPDDVAHAALYLAQGGPFLTGTTIRVDGGRLLS